MSERREGYVTHDNLWSNQAYDLHGDKTRIHVREVGDEYSLNEFHQIKQQRDEAEAKLAALRDAAKTYVDKLKEYPNLYAILSDSSVPIKELEAALTESEAGDE